MLSPKTDSASENRCSIPTLGAFNSLGGSLIWLQIIYTGIHLQVVCTSSHRPSTVARKEDCCLVFLLFHSTSLSFINNWKTSTVFLRTFTNWVLAGIDYYNIKMRGRRYLKTLVISNVFVLPPQNNNAYNTQNFHLLPWEPFMVLGKRPVSTVGFHCIFS